MPELSRIFQNPPDNSKDGIKMRRTQDWLCIDCPRSAKHALRFYVSSDGSKIISNKPDIIPVNDLESFILGPILGCVLRLRNRICLHASVLEYNGKVIAMVGDKGAGKSTTAAALLQAGARLVSDDIAVLHNNDTNTHMVYPGYPGIRLLPEVLPQFGLNQHNYRPVVSTSDKRIIPLAVNQQDIESNDNWKFQSRPQQLTTIYALKPRMPDLTHTKITTLSGKNALIAIAPHSYARRVLDEQHQNEEFTFMAQLARSMPVKSVECPDKLECLPQVANDILNDLDNTA